MYVDSSPVCTNQIKQLYYVNEGKTVKLRDVDGPLYLLFIGVAEYDANGNPVRELMRRKLRINWENED
jgi:hypothetical protein